MSCYQNRLATLALSIGLLAGCSGCSVLSHSSPRVSLAIPGKKGFRLPLLNCGQRTRRKPSTSAPDVCVNNGATCCAAPDGCTSQCPQQRPEEYRTVQAPLPSRPLPAATLDSESHGAQKQTSSADGKESAGNEWNQSGHAPAPDSIRQAGYVDSRPVQIRETTRTFYPTPPMQRATVVQALPPCDACEVPCGPCEVPCGEAAVNANQIAALMSRVGKLEKNLTSSHQEIDGLKKSLAVANNQIGLMKRDLRHWEKEVARLETAMEKQHESDIASLTRISNMLGMIVEDEHPQENGK